MRTKRTGKNLFRLFVSGLISVVGTFIVLQILANVADVDFTDPVRSVVTSYVVAWPLYVLVYVAWSYRVYSRLGSAALKQTTEADDADESGPLTRLLNVSGATNTTLSAAVISVLVTVLIAQQPEFRSDPVYVLLALVTVASSWLLMVFSFAQSYMRLGASANERAHFHFHFPDPPRFSDYLTLALTLSASAATVSAEGTSRTAWRLIRANVVIAFVFNSVIIAMMVSLVFGGLG
jgi:uncharacterized membrane protein